MIVHFLNLTNGIEALPVVRAPHFVRIQSTALEQKRWGAVLADLDYDFLLHVASGAVAVVHDYSARKAAPRSLYQGLPWIEFALHRCWRDETLGVCRVKAHNCARFFAECYEVLPASTLAKLRYARRFDLGGAIRLIGVPNRTAHDGDDAFYREALLEVA